MPHRWRFLASGLHVAVVGFLLVSCPILPGEAFLYFNNGSGPLHRSMLDGSNVTSPLGPAAIGSQVQLGPDRRLDELAGVPR